MSRKLSLLILAGTALAIGVLFFRVVRPFIFPLLFAAILAVLFRPVYLWAIRVCYGRRRIAAAVVTVGVICLIMLPLGGVLTLAGIQLVEAGRSFVEAIDLPENAEDTKRLVDPENYPQLAQAWEAVRSRLSDENIRQLRQFSSNALLGVTQTLYERTTALAGDVIAFTVGMVIMVLALYYFLADGDQLMSEARRLSPLEQEDEEVLFGQFADVCRGVILGTVVAGVVQGILAGIGFAILGVDRVWLLVVFTIFFSFIPFLGAASVWIFVTIGLLLDQQWGAAIFLTIYGTIIVSGTDNLIRAYIIHDRAQMHPLVALVTVLGALQLVGLWGIFVGPITAAFFYAMLNTLRRRLLDDFLEDDGTNADGDESAESPEAEASGGDSRAADGETASS